MATLVLRNLLKVILTMCCGVLLVASAARAESKTWNVATEFPLIKKNPAPDRYGHKSVWYYMYGEAMGGAVHKLKYFYDPAEEEAACGVEGFYGWDALKHNLQGTPAIWYNAGPTVEGTDYCSGSTTFLTKTVFMHPEHNGNAYAVVGWRAPVTGMVTVSGSVEPVDIFVTGITWELDHGASVLAGPTETDEVTPTLFGPTVVSVHKGEYLYLEIGRAASASGAADSTGVTLTITSS